MVGINDAIRSNIVMLLRKNNMKQNDLASSLGVSKQVISNMLNGNRMINAVELSRIASFFHISMESLVAVPDGGENVNAVHVFMGEVKSAEAMESLKIADELADMVLFYAKVNENAAQMNRSWEA